MVAYVETISCCASPDLDVTTDPGKLCDVATQGEAYL